MAKENINVLPDKNGWAVKRGNAKTTAGKYATKREATAAARRIAGEQHLDLVIYERGRRFTEIRTSDPKLAHVPEKAAFGKGASAGVKATTVEKVKEAPSTTKSQLWREWASGHREGASVLSDEAISRESIYGDRG